MWHPICDVPILSDDKVEDKKTSKLVASEKEYSFIDDGYVYQCPNCEERIDNKDIHPFMGHYICPHCDELQDTLITYKKSGLGER